MPEITTFNSSEDELPQNRLLSLDMFRGLVLALLLLEAANYGWQHHIGAAYPDSWLARFVEFHATHVPWVGFSLWDLIQPAFLFMVGVSMAFSFAKRARMGDRNGDLAVHALIRSLILIFLGIFLRSIHSESTNWTFEDVLTQIGLGYFFVYLMWQKWWRIQAVTALVVLFLYWLMFVIWPVPENVDWAIAAGDGWKTPLEGFAAHWNKNVNPAHHFDVWFLNGFPRSEPFVANEGGYQTLNFIPAFVTMLFGLMTGEYLREEQKGWAIPKFLCFLGVIGMLVGVLLALGPCPMVKRIWTPSWTIFSAGACLVGLASLYGMVELLNWRTIARPFRVLGMNSIVIYVMCWTVAPWLNQMLKIHFGENYGNWFGAPFQPLIENIIVLIVIWLIAWWMYRRRIFLRI
ncbi:MAG: DUF5009 domain-containing protein [Verrucomicrobiales bacterium]|nr:DUF5009 domain-containing protein [Verrucomicrobiales bacterium]